MLFLPSASGLVRCARLAAALAALVLLCGCAASSGATAPAISASSELAVSDLNSSTTAAVVTAESVAESVPTSSTIPASTTGPASSLVPTTTIDVSEEAVTDPRAAQALDRIGFAWRQTLPGWSIVFRPARTGLRGLTKVEERRIEIYVRDSDSADSILRVLAHELGHAVDVELNSPSDRERWRTARGVGPTVAWWPGNAVSDFDTLAGDFAEAFATLLTGSVSQSRVAPPPGPAELAMLAEKVVHSAQGDPETADRYG